MDITKDGFTALNVHYIPPELRIALMRQLFKYATNQAYDRNTTMRFNYKTLKSASSMPFYKQCFKRYLNSHVCSRFIEILPAEWTAPVFLPDASF